MNSKKIELRFTLIRTLIAILIAYSLALIIILFASKQPLTAISLFLFGPLTSFRRFANVIEMMIPFIFTGLAITVMQKANSFNVIGEGVFFISGAVSAYIAINTALPAVLSPMVLILVSGILGALIALIPAILKLKWKANELVSSIMMNYILFFFSMYLLNYWMRDINAGYNASYKIPLVSKLPVIIPGTRIHFGLILAIIAVAVISFIMYKTKLGYSITMVGENEKFANYSGIKTVSIILIAQMIGGFLAGVGGSVEILGMYNRFQWEVLTNHGFDGVLVGVLSRKNPLVLPVSAFFLAYMRTGADIAARSTDIPVEFVSVVQAIVLMLVGAQMFLEAWKKRAIVKSIENSPKVEVQ